MQTGARSTLLGLPQLQLHLLSVGVQPVALLLALHQLGREEGAALRLQTQKGRGGGGQWAESRRVTGTSSGSGGRWEAGHKESK